MYNNSRKREYISYKRQDNINATMFGMGFFNRVENIESYLDKDACDFTTVEIINLLKSVSSDSSGYVYNLKNYLEQYTRWCQQNGLLKDGQNHYEEITVDTIKKECINVTTLKSKLTTKSELLYTINSIPRPCDRFLCLAIFEGIGGVKYKELWNLTLDDFDEEYVNLCTGRRLRCSLELLKLAQLSSETYDDNNSRLKFKKSDNRILKARDNTKDIETPLQLYRRIWLQLDRLSGQYGVKMSGKGLKESGRISMIKELMVDGEALEETYIKNKEEIEYRYGKLRRFSDWVNEYYWAFENEE